MYEPSKKGFSKAKLHDYFPTIEDKYEKKLLNMAMKSIVNFSEPGEDQYQLETGSVVYVIEISFTSVGMKWPETDMVANIAKSLEKNFLKVKMAALGAVKGKSCKSQSNCHRFNEMFDIDNGKKDTLHRSRVVVKTSAVHSAP